MGQGRKCVSGSLREIDEQGRDPGCFGRRLRNEILDAKTACHFWQGGVALVQKSPVNQPHMAMAYYPWVDTNLLDASTIGLGDVGPKLAQASFTVDC